MNMLYAAPVLLLSSVAVAAAAEPGERTMAPVVVESSLINPIGAADSATEGTVTGKQLENRPLQRTGALLEAVPQVATVTLKLPNRHHVAVDLAAVGRSNSNEVFVVLDRPFGLIEATVGRS